MRAQASEEFEIAKEFGHFGWWMLKIFLGYAKFVAPLVMAFRVGMEYQIYNSFSGYPHLEVWWFTFYTSGILALLISGMMLVLKATVVANTHDYRGELPWNQKPGTSNS